MILVLLPNKQDFIIIYFGRPNPPEGGGEPDPPEVTAREGERSQRQLISSATSGNPKQGLDKGGARKCES